MGEPQSLSNNDISSNNLLFNINTNTKKKPVENADFPPSDDEPDNLKLPTRCSERSSFHFDLSGLRPTDISVADEVIRDGSLVPLDLVNKQEWFCYGSAELASKQPYDHDAHNAVGNSVRTSRSNAAAASSRPISLHSSSYSSPIGSPVDILRASYNKSVFTGGKSGPLYSFDRKNKKPNSKKISVVKCIRSMVHFCKKVKEIRLDEVRRGPLRSGDRDRAAVGRTKSGCSSPLHDAGREHAIKEAILHCKSSSRKYMENFAVGGDERIKK